MLAIMYWYDSISSYYTVNILFIDKSIQKNFVILKIAILSTGYV